MVDEALSIFHDRPSSFRHVYGSCRNSEGYDALHREPMGDAGTGKAENDAQHRQIEPSGFDE